jgi:hypothetical protein
VGKQPSAEGGWRVDAGERRLGPQRGSRMRTDGDR